MSFDQPTRNALAKMVGECRRLLTANIRKQLQAVYGLQPDGTALPLDTLGHLDERGRESARELREWQEHLAANEVGSEAKRWEGAFDRLARETSFTVLNRLAALRLCEERGHVVECVRRGMASDGFQLFERLSGGALGPRGETYLVFLDRMFDELATDLGMLFDLRDPCSLVFPDEQCLDQVLALLNVPTLSQLWQQDETIGWIYQYFNDPAERKKMRESPAPRNSYELAVRNQFFTPRYVVEFLTDNTLGRIWYEMTQGQTGLRDQCRYLVRQPNEIFLKEGESAPAHDPKAAEGLSKEELLKQPVYIPSRPLKDPREIRLLDPACGSMHFGLYAFDLFEVIYHEWWQHHADEHTHAEVLAACAKAEGRADTASMSEADFYRHIPRLIIEHNLHGIDIDPRCAQIAGLSLWLRAQKSWQRLGLKPAERPTIKRSNIVCAEPMPGEKELLREFVEREFPAAERSLFRRLLEAIFDKMQLAGEAGSLLKIEEEIRSDIAEAKNLWKEGPKPRQTWLFPEAAPAEPKQMKLDLSGITDEQFWERAEDRIYAALRDYAERAENGYGFQRRLFAEDAARGFAFVDVCRQRYDVALMNPPFGEATKRTRDWVATQYPRTKHDLLASFCERGLELLLNGGKLGEISSRVAFFLKSFEQWRTDILRPIKVDFVVDLGSDVLDDAMVESACYVLSKRTPRGEKESLIIRLVLAEDKGTGLFQALTSLCDKRRFVVPIDHARALPHSPLIYWISSATLQAIASHPPLEPNFALVRQGLGTGDNNRFIRTVWEVSPESLATASATAHSSDFRTLFDRDKRWAYHVRAGSSQPWYSPLTLVIDWESQGARLKEHWRSKGETPSRYIPSEDLYFRPGFSWTRRAFRFIPSLLSGQNGNNSS